MPVDPDLHRQQHHHAAAVYQRLLRPLVGHNKDEIIAESKVVGTHDLSAKVGEYCAIVPSRPATHAKLDDVLEEEAKLDPGVLEEATYEPASLEGPVIKTLDDALVSLATARKREGGRLAEALLQRCEGILSIISVIRPRIGGAEKRYRAKLQERLARLAIEPNPERLEQEIALLTQRLDISEEIDRLEGHVEEVRDVLGRDEAIGRRLDFLIQELNREANTLASKAQDADLTRDAVELKVLIEQMREQAQNLE